MSGPFAGHSGLLAFGMVLVTLGGCCPQTEDPDDPSATDQAQFVDAWLDDLQAGRDAEAFERLEPRPDLDGWGLERFTLRVDRLGMLRGPASITWESARWRWQESNPNRRPLERRVLSCIANANPSMQLEGTLQHAATTHSLSLIVSMHDGMLIKGLEIDEQPLIPTGRSNIVTRTPEPDLRADPQERVGADVEALELGCREHRSDPAGLRKPVGALFGVRAESLDFPCTVTVELTRNSPYERSTQTLYEGCATTTNVDAGPCP